MIGFEQIDIDKYLPFSNEWLNFSLILVIALTPVFLSIYFKNKKSSQ